MIFAHKSLHINFFLYLYVPKNLILYGKINLLQIVGRCFFHISSFVCGKLSRWQNNRQSTIARTNS